MTVLPGPEMRAAVVAVIHRLTLGWPELTTDDLLAWPVSPAELGLLEQHDDADLALVNALLEVEADYRAQEYAALERLLAQLQWSEGEGNSLEDRIKALPGRAYGRAAANAWALGWVTLHRPEQED